jgi:hypothetical protein
MRPATQLIFTKLKAGLDFKPPVHDGECSYVNLSQQRVSPPTPVDEIEAAKFPDSNKAQQLSIGCEHLQ